MAPNFTSLTPLSFLERASVVFGDKEAVVHRERRITYRQMADEATRMAHALRDAGMGKGDRVAYLMPNIPEMLIAHFAVPLAGCVLVAINTRLSGSEIEYILNHSGARALVIDTELYPGVAEQLDAGHHAGAGVDGGEDDELGLFGGDKADEGGEVGLLVVGAADHLLARAALELFRTATPFTVASTPTSPARRPVTS